LRLCVVLVEIFHVTVYCTYIMASRMPYVWYTYTSHRVPRGAITW
jgi:hypothetical protein